MAAGQTALDLIKGSMRLVGIIATGETPTSDEANDGLNTLNDLLETWSTQSLAVNGEANEIFATIAGQATYTIGPAGNFNTVRPVRISGGYCTFGGVDFPVDTGMAQGEYDAIALKTMQQPIVERLMYVNDNPLGRITLWPVPSGIIPLVLGTSRILTSIAALTTVIAFPPGYYITMKHALGIMLAPDYGATPSAEVIEIARAGMASLKRANKTRSLASFDSALVDTPVMWQTGN